MNDVVGELTANKLASPFSDVTQPCTMSAVSEAVGLLKISRMKNDFARSGQLSMSRLKISLTKNAISH